jgi:hypothetical protein
MGHSSSSATPIGFQRVGRLMLHATAEQLIFNMTNFDLLRVESAYHCHRGISLLDTRHWGATMTGRASTRSLATQVAEEARSVARKLSVGGVELRIAVEDLERSALAFSETSSSLSGFQSRDDESSLDEPTEYERLAMIAEELEVGRVLIAAGVATSEVDVDHPSDVLLEATQQLEDALGAERSEGPLTAGFAPVATAGSDDHSGEALLRQTSEAIDGIVSGSLLVLEDAWTRLRDLPPKAVAEVAKDIAAVIGEVPQIGKLVRLGLRAVKRALAAIIDFVPDQLRKKARELANAWWGENGANVGRNIVAGLLSAGDVRAYVDNVDVASLESNRVKSTIGLIAALSGRFDQLAGVLRRIVRALAAAVGAAALLAILPAVTTWVPAVAAAGYLVIAGSVLVIARDYLDTSGSVAWVNGVQHALASAVAR